MSIMVDRANVNGADDYRQAHKAGVRWAYFKASQGQGFTDATYHSRRKAARAAGIVTGAYMFSDNTDPVREAEHFLDVIGEQGARIGELRPCIDIERSPNGVPTLAHTIALAEHLHAKLGYWPVIYGSTSVLAPYRAASLVVRACPYWRAEYGSNDGRDHGLTGGDQGASAHQYTSVGRVAGVSGYTDLSRVIRGDVLFVPRPKPSKPKRPPAVMWRWARWRLGLGEYEGHQADPEMRPSRAPARIPLRWWGAVRWYQKNVVKPAKKAAKAPLEPEKEVIPQTDGNGTSVAQLPKRSHHKKPEPAKEITA
jgi:lysozyme